MKIAIFTDSYYPMLNGVTISIANLAKELRALGHSVYIFAPKFDGFIDTEIDVYRLKAFKILSSEPEVHMPFVLPHKLVKEIQRHDFDIVHAHGNGFFSFLGYQVAKVKGVPFILTFHTQMTQYMHYLFNGRLVTPRMAARAMRIWGNICDIIVTPSEKMKKELISYGVKKNISVVPNFVYGDKFRTKQKNFLHDLCMIPRSSPILLSVGRLGKEKNFSFLIKSFQKISLKDNTVHLVIIGDGEEADSIKKLATKLKLDDKVHFPGKISQEDIPKAYADADIFVFSSTSEVHPMVVLEAAAAGLPFVVVNDGAYANIVVNDGNGYLVSPQISLFAQKVLQLLQDNDMRQKFGKVSSQMVEEHFNPQKLTEEMLTVYREAISRQKTGRMNLRRINKAAVKRLYQTTGFFGRIFQ